MPDKKGFTMLEMLVTMAILCMLAMVSIPMFQTLDFSDDLIVYEALLAQSKAMAFQNEESVMIQGIELRYNSYGNVSQSRTFVFDKDELIVELGWGRLVKK